MKASGEKIQTATNCVGAKACNDALLPASVWGWGCMVPPLLCAATPQEQSPATATAEIAKSAVVTAITSAITVDGALVEQVWQTAPKIGELTQREPQTGEKPTEPTDITLLHDANTLYIGVICYDSKPQRVHCRETVF